MHLHKPTIEATQNIQAPKAPTNQSSAKTTKPNRKQNAQGFQIVSSKKHQSMHLSQPKQKKISFFIYKFEFDGI